MGEFTSPWLTWVPKDPRVERDMRGEALTKRTKAPREVLLSVLSVSLAGSTGPTIPMAPGRGCPLCWRAILNACGTSTTAGSMTSSSS